MVDVHRDNPEAFQQLDLKLKELQGWEGLTGWAEDSKYPAGQQVAYIAQIQEFGHGAIPPRPFMRPAIAKNTNNWFDLAGSLARQIIDGKITGQKAMTKLAEEAAEDVQQSIDDVKSPPLSEITLWARYYRKKLGYVTVKNDPDDKLFTGKTVGEIASKLKSGELKGAPPGISDKPLVDTEQMKGEVIGEARQI